MSRHLACALLTAVFVLSMGGLTLPCRAQSGACDDLSQVDFGACALPLGVGVVDGRCQSISGCESPITLFTSVQECEDTCPTCSDLAGIDFGPCEAILGAGVIAGTCELISGCASPVPLFTSVVNCESMCNVLAVEDIEWGMVKTLYRRD